jgi:hypothetical protein
MDRRRMAWDSGAVLILGLWLVVAPLFLGYGFVGAAVWNGLFVGTLVIILAGVKAFGQFRNPAAGWLNVLLGAWLVLAPFVLDYSAANRLLWNAVIVGLLIIVLSWRSATASN